MADNYLEKQMEDYRAGKLAPKTRAVHVTSAPLRNPGDFVMAFPQLRVVLLGGDVRLVEVLARMFRDVECRVALCSPDSKSFTPLAQSTGCRYYPFDPAIEAKRLAVIYDLTDRWGGVDVVVDLREAEGSEESEFSEFLEKSKQSETSEESELSEQLKQSESTESSVSSDESIRSLATLLFLHSHPQFGCIKECVIEG